MKYYTNFFLLLFLFLFSCSKKITPYEKRSLKHNIYNQYCFASGFCTDTLFIRFIQPVGVANSIGRVQDQDQDTIFTKKFINPLTVKNHSDSIVIAQFLLSLEAYNYYGMGKKEFKRPMIWTQHAFFRDIENMKAHYVSDVNGSKLELYNLSDLLRYDFKYQFTETRDHVTGNITVSFDNYSTYFVCSMNLFDEIIFQRYLNYISKNHRIPPYILGVKPIGL